MVNDDILRKLKPFYKTLEESQDKSTKSFYDYFKNITTISIGLLGLLIGLKPDKIPDDTAKFLFLVSLVSLALVCVFSLVTQFGETALHKNYSKSLREHIKSVILNNTELKSKVLTYKINIFYKFSEITTYFCLIIAIISLVSYVYFSEY